MPGAGPAVRDQQGLVEIWCDQGGSTLGPFGAVIKLKGERCMSAAIC